MRITSEERAANRERIVAAAASLFREKGFDGIGVADLMRAAGLTHGGFYNHFASKEELEGAACDLAFDKAVARLAAIAEQTGPARRRAFADYVARYLSRETRDEPVVCPMVSLAADAARRGGAPRRRFASGVRRYLDALVAAVRRPKMGDGAARDDAIVTLAMLVGGLLLARGVNEADPQLSDQVLAAVRTAILPTDRTRRPAGF